MDFFGDRAVILFLREQSCTAAILNSVLEHPIIPIGTIEFKIVAVSPKRSVGVSLLR